MTETLISLLSILFGILGAVVFGKLKPKYSLGFTANSIIGVFVSIFILKSFGRLGFAPNNIVSLTKIHYLLLMLNLSVSCISGMLGLWIVFNIQKKIPR
ncbi:hypothetical protein FHR24_001523 [Wenyingzhuangia heitensis]|uniref:Fluoride ion transporter CrcB n=1 Tax=Wenyingzhuangia heitensis TaxID=1487859 RepID=A0ABX0U9P8_9FLAO|nr:hypothetical protein [Wenyingzhuangia heitensis]NIJ45084.1 hypothetical protein [Wenyingzhuangia heitensis]